METETVLYPAPPPTNTSRPGPQEVYQSMLATMDAQRSVDLPIDVVLAGSADDAVLAATSSLLSAVEEVHTPSVQMLSLKQIMHEAAAGPPMSTMAPTPATVLTKTRRQR